MPERMAPARSWRDIAPADAVGLDLSTGLSVDAPLNEAGERCPWPWEPQQLAGAPMGQYHCGYCGAMCIAGLPHPDYRISIRHLWSQEEGASMADTQEGRCT